MARIIIKIDKETGAMQIEGEGFKGPVCEEKIKEILQLRASDFDSFIKKPEYDDLQEIEIGGEINGER